MLASSSSSSCLLLSLPDVCLVEIASFLLPHEIDHLQRSTCKNLRDKHKAGVFDNTLQDSIRQTFRILPEHDALFEEKNYWPDLQKFFVVLSRRMSKAYGLHPVPVVHSALLADRVVCSLFGNDVSDTFHQLDGGHRKQPLVSSTRQLAGVFWNTDRLYSPYAMVGDEDEFQDANGIPFLNAPDNCGGWLYHILIRPIQEPTSSSSSSPPPPSDHTGGTSLVGFSVETHSDGVVGDLPSPYGRMWPSLESLLVLDHYPNRVYVDADAVLDWELQALSWLKVRDLPPFDRTRVAGDGVDTGVPLVPWGRLIHHLEQEPLDSNLDPAEAPDQVSLATLGFARRAFLGGQRYGELMYKGGEDATRHGLRMHLP